MNTLVTILVSVCLISAAQLALGFPTKQHLEKGSNLTCIIQHNLDGRMLQLGALTEDVPPKGQLIFTHEPLNNTTVWNPIYLENSTSLESTLVRLRNVEFNHYLTIFETWATSYEEGIGSYEESVWRLEYEWNDGLYLVHNSSNLCMGVEYLETWIGDWYVPYMNQTCGDSWFKLTCIE